MKTLQEENIKIKIAISLRILLDKSKWNTQTKGKDDSIGDSHNTIALNAYIRKATVRLGSVRFISEPVHAGSGS